MKVNKTITLDLDVYRKLNEEKNGSAIINSYLRHYYDLDVKIKEKKNE